AIVQAVFPIAPAGGHAVGCALHDGFDLMNFSALNLEELGELPGPELRGAGGDLAAVGSFEIARVATGVIEKDEAENQAPLGIDGDEAAVTNPRNEVQQAGFELLHATPLAGVAGGGFRIGTSGAGGRGLICAVAAVLDAVAI